MKTGRQRLRPVMNDAPRPWGSHHHHRTLLDRLLTASGSGLHLRAVRPAGCVRLYPAHVPKASERSSRMDAFRAFSRESIIIENDCCSKSAGLLPSRPPRTNGGSDVAFLRLTARRAKDARTTEEASWPKVNGTDHTVGRLVRSWPTPSTSRLRLRVSVGVWAYSSLLPALSARKRAPESLSTDGQTSKSTYGTSRFTGNVTRPLGSLESRRGPLSRKCGLSQLLSCQSECEC